MWNDLLDYRSLTPCRPRLSPPRYSWTLEATADAATPTSLTVKIKHPPEGGPFDRYIVAVCRKPQSGAPKWDQCPSSTCLPSQASSCTIAGLAPNTAYVLSAVAWAGETASSRSDVLAASTPPYP